MVKIVVFGEDDPTRLQHKIGFKNLRNVHYLPAACWARLVEEDAIRSASLGRRDVSSRFEPRVILEGVRGHAIFEKVMRVTGDDVPTFGRIIDEAANPEESKLFCHFAWLEPQALQLTPVNRIRRSKNASRDEATDARLRLPLKEEA